MSCNCNCNRRNEATSPLLATQSGDTVPLVFAWRGGAFPTGTALLAGLYGANGEMLASASSEDGTLVREGLAYRWELSHAMTEKMVGAVTLELTLVGGDGSVDHSENTITITFDPRGNNALVP